MSDKNFNKPTGENNEKGANSKMDHLVKIASSGYSISGYAPVSSSWKLTPDQIKSIVLKIAKGFLNDIHSVTLDVNRKNGAVNVLVWIPADSSNLKDNSAMAENSAIRRSFVRYSPTLKEFMDKFCADDKKRVISEDSNRPVVGIEVLLARFLRIEFDANGEQFSREYGQGKFRSDLRFTANYNQGDGRDNFGRLTYIEVTKSLNRGIDQYEPRPKRSYNAH